MAAVLHGVVGNVVAAGLEGRFHASDRSAFGAGLFLKDNGTVRFMPAAGQTERATFSPVDAGEARHAELMLA
jgi:hypothetical protein